MVRVGFALISALVIPATAVQSAAQPKPAQEAPLVFDDVIEVRVVDVEAVVTDHSGERVSGLVASDFKLIVDGRAVRFDYFSEIEEGVARAVPSDTALEDRAQENTAVAQEAIGTHYLLYVDDNHTSFADRKPVLAGVLDAIDDLRPTDRMSVVTLSGIGVESLIVGSQSKPDLKAAVSRLMTREFGGQLRSSKVAARRGAITRPRAGRHDVSAEGEQRNPTIIEQTFDLTAEDPNAFEALRNAERRVDLEHAVTGVISTLRAFREVPGRRALLLLAGDWPSGTFERPGKTVGTMTDLDVIRPMVETANLLGYTIYPIGLTLAKRDLLLKGVLDTVARATGGTTLLRVSSALTDAIKDTASYYSLGFVPRLRGDDARHEIRVEVTRPGLSVRTRASYIDLSQSAQLTMAAQTALLFGNSSEDSNLQLTAGRAERAGFRKMRVPFELRVPVDELVFIRQRDEHVAAFEVRIAVIDDSGTQLDRIPIMPVTLRGERRDGEVYQMSLNLEMRRRPHLLVVTLYDRFADASLTKRMRLSFRSTQSDSSEREEGADVQLVNDGVE